MAGQLQGRLKQKDIDAAKGVEGKTLKKSDGQGLYLFVSKTNYKTWYIIYRFAGQSKKHRIGNYPAIDLQTARQKAVDFQRVLAQGLDPVAELERQAKEQAVLAAKQERTWDSTFQEWFELRLKARSQATQRRVLLYKKVVDQFFAGKKISDIAFEDIVKVVRYAESRFKSVATFCQYLASVFDYARLLKYINDSPCENISKILERREIVVEHRAAITDLTLLRLVLNRLDAANYCLITDNIFKYSALNLVILLGCRTQELVGSTWDEVDLQNGVFTIPASRMKTRKEHVIYLSKQAVKYFELCKKYQQNNFVIWGGSKDGHFAQESLLTALRVDLGFDAKTVCVHGFRATLESVALSLAAPLELINIALSHSVGNEVCQAYFRQGALADRMRRFWQWWADVIDAIKAGQEPAKWHE